MFHSVGQPFKGDYLEINKNPKYQKLNSVVDEKVLLADVVNKINRANGKVSLKNTSLSCLIDALNMRLTNHLLLCLILRVLPESFS